MEIIEEATVIPTTIENAQLQERTFEWTWYHLLPFAALAIYMFTPILSWQFGFPSAIKFLGDFLVIVMIGLTIAHMLNFDHIPGAFLIILTLIIIGTIVALFEGQSLGVTIYGWWMMFRFPLVGLYVYLVPNWKRSTASWIPNALVWILAIQVVAQIALYMSGIRAFDHLGGTFGRNGVGQFVYFILLVLAFALGKWLIFGEWNLLIISLILSSFASAMGEMKLFAIAAPLMAIIIFGFHILRGGNTRQLILYIFFFLVAGTSFYYAYEKFLVEDLGISPLEDFLQTDTRDRYFDSVWNFDGSWHLGRSAEVEYGWQLMQRDNTNLLFGYGLGSRQHSPELNLVGNGVRQSLYGFYVGRSLLVLTYESGLIGLAILLLFIVTTVILLYRSTYRDPDRDMNVVRIGILLYTVFFPIWIWYKEFWILPAPSILYWMIWGYAMHFSVGLIFKKRSPVRPLKRYA